MISSFSLPNNRLQVLYRNRTVDLGFCFFLPFRFLGGV